MAHHRPDQGGSNRPPLRSAELDGANSGMPMSPDGTPIFEMPAESAPAASDRTEKPQKQSSVQELEGSQANPWPYHGPGGDDGPAATVVPQVAAQDFAAGGILRPGPTSGEVGPSATGTSSVPAPDVPHGTRASTVSPVSPSDGQFFPAPLQINKPPPSEPKYKPYSPEMSHDFQHAPRPPATSSPPPAGHTATVAYRPYRRPSYKESPAPTAAQPAHASPGPASPPFEPPKASGTPPYPMGMAPHHFYMPASPDVPEDTRPSLSPRLDHRHSPSSAQATGNSAAPSQSPPPAHPAASGPKEAIPQPVPGGQTSVSSESRPEEIVLLPHPPQAQEAIAPAQAPVVPPQHTRPPTSPRPQGYDQHLSPTHTGTSSTSPVQGYQHPPPPPAQSSAPTSPGYAPRPPHASSTHSGSPATSPPPQSYNRPQASPRPSKLPTAEPQDPIPQEPPPAYSDIAPRPGSQPPPSEKPSMFPQAPSSAPQTPMPQGHPQQPTYASSSHPTHTSPPPLHQPYGAPQQNLHPPPPLPPRPSSSHSTSSHHNQPPQHPQQPTYANKPAGFSGPAPAPGGFPRPPKTNYVPQHPPPGAPGAQYTKPSYGNAYGNKFLGGSAKKWLDKTNQFVENKIGEVLQNHPDPKYRPQPGTYGYQGPTAGVGHQQHYPPQPPGGYPQSPPQGAYAPHPGHGHPQQHQYAQPPGPPGPRP